jgi:hypothetical protein
MDEFEDFDPELLDFSDPSQEDLGAFKLMPEPTNSLNVSDQPFGFNMTGSEGDAAAMVATDIVTNPEFFMQEVDSAEFVAFGSQQQSVPDTGPSWDWAFKSVESGNKVMLDEKDDAEMIAV